MGCMVAANSCIWLVLVPNPSLFCQQSWQLFWFVLKILQGNT